MKKLALVGASLAGILAVAVFTSNDAEAQTRRNGAIVLGDSSTAVKVKGSSFSVATPYTCDAAGACGSIALTSGTPSTATVTVPAGVTCVCWPVGTTAAIAAGGCAANVSTTTLTLTGPNTVTTTMRYMCFL